MKKILFYAVIAICAFSVNAQEVSPDEVAKLKKEMNEIKKSGDFIFAEGLSEYLSDDGDKAVTQAQKQSMDKLHAQIVVVFAKHLHMSPEDVEEIWDVIDDKCQNVEITAGDVSRSFLYVSKEVISGLLPDIHLFPNWEKRKKERELQEQAAAESEMAVLISKPEKPETVAAEVVEELKTEAEKQVAEPVVAEVVEEQKAEPEVKADEHVAAVVKDDVEAVAQNVATTQPVEEPKKEVAEPVVEPKKETVAVDATAEPVIETPKEEVTEKQETPVTTPTESVEPVTPVVETPAPAAPAVKKVEVPALCQKMLDRKDLETLRRFLDTEKVYERLIYGPERYMRRAAECYIVILDKNTRNIVTVLDKGVTDRMNFVTGKMDSFATYQMAGGYMAIFVQEL